LIGSCHNNRSVSEARLAVSAGLSVCHSLAGDLADSRWRASGILRGSQTADWRPPEDIFLVGPSLTASFCNGDFHRSRKDGR
jgi:hypothetical protein